MKFLAARYSTVLPACILAIGASAASGALLTPPAGPVGPDTWTSCTGCTEVGSGIFGFGSAGGGLGFVYGEGVFTNDPLNPFGVNGLDFVFSLLNNATSTSSIASVAAANFGNFNTDVGYFTSAAFPGGSIAPSTVSRTVANTVNFGFSGFAPGDQSVVFVIKTNASAFGSGTLTVADGSGVSGTVAGLAPVPEPNLVWPAGLLLSVALFVSRKLRQTT